MQLRERASVVGSLVAVAVVTIAVSARPSDRAPQHAVWIDNRGGCADVPAVDHGTVGLNTDSAALEVMLPEADRLYRALDIDGAARVARDAARHDARFESVAELYIQFAHAWSIGTAPDLRPTDTYEALREARKLDLVLGGVFAGELDQRLVRVVPRAAIAYTAQRRYEEAAIVVSVADALGVDDEALEAVRSKLELEHVKL